MNSLDDIYRRIPIVTTTDEHILPGALGGRLTCDTLIDRSTNNELGTQIDSALADTFLMVRIFLNATSGDNREPPKLKNLRGHDGRAYNLLPGGVPEAAAPEITRTVKEGVFEVSGSFRSMRELRQTLRGICEKHGVDLATVEKAAMPTKEAAPTMHAPLNFGPLAFRAVAKTACNLFARSYRDEFLLPEFDGVRAWIESGDGVVWDHLRFSMKPIDLDVDPHRLGTLDHLVVVRSDGADVTALVALFGHIQFVVKLGTMRAPRRIFTSYRVNQVERLQRIDDGRDRKVVPRFAKCAAAPWRRVFHVVELQMNKMMRAVMERQRRDFERSILRDAMRAAMGPAMKLTKDNVGAVSRAIGEAYTQYLIDFDLLKDEYKPDWLSPTSKENA